VQREKQKALPRLGALDPKSQQALDAMCDSIVAQLLHQPLSELKRGQHEPEGAALVGAAQRLFGLDPASGDNGAGDSVPAPAAEPDPKSPR
jgi:glutamyl-tRNA reductase